LSLDAGSGGAAPEDGTARQMLAKLLRASDEYDDESSPGLHDAWTITCDAARAYLASATVAAERAAPNPYEGAVIHALSALLKATYLDQVPDEATNDWWRDLATTARREYDHLRSGAPSAAVAQPERTARRAMSENMAAGYAECQADVVAWLDYEDDTHNHDAVVAIEAGEHVGAAARERARKGGA
jgi:predicted secreted protein